MNSDFIRKALYSRDEGALHLLANGLRDPVLRETARRLAWDARDSNGVLHEDVKASLMTLRGFLGKVDMPISTYYEIADIFDAAVTFPNAKAAKELLTKIRDAATGRSDRLLMCLNLVESVLNETSPISRVSNALRSMSFDFSNTVGDAYILASLMFLVEFATCPDARRATRLTEQIRSSLKELETVETVKD